VNFHVYSESSDRLCLTITEYKFDINSFEVVPYLKAYMNLHPTSFESFDRFSCNFVHIASVTWILSSVSSLYLISRVTLLIYIYIYIYIYIFALWQVFKFHNIVNGSGTTQPPIQWVPGALSLGEKRPGREADHSPPSSAEVKEWLELYLHSPICLHGVVLS
jgi:hypothetical protein